MTVALADYRTRVLALLDDAGLTRYTNALVDQALRNALETYSLFKPLVSSYAFDSTGEYREYLDTDFIATAIRAIEQWPLTVTSGVPIIITQIPFYAYIQDEQWIFETKSKLLPAGSLLYIIYEHVHTIDDLDSASATTIPLEDTELIAIGAAGHASRMRANSQIEANNLNAGEGQQLLSTSTAWLNEFNSRIGGDTLIDQALDQRMVFVNNKKELNKSQAFDVASWHDPSIDKNY